MGIYRRSDCLMANDGMERLR